MSERPWAERVKPHLGRQYELDKLWQEHEQYEAELAELEKVKWPTNEQEFERRRLQKAKLAGKDRMLAIVDVLETGAQRDEATS